MRLTRLIATFGFLSALAASPAWAGPPLICHTIPIGSQASLPWAATQSWNGVLASYDVAQLQRDTLALLAPSAPLDVRMETLRRAAIYSARGSALADSLTIALMARVVNAQAAGTESPAAWFDAGYFAETLRQAAGIYPLLHGSERDQWMIRSAVQQIDGLAWMRMAVRSGGGERMNSAVTMVERAAGGR